MVKLSILYAINVIDILAEGHPKSEGVLNVEFRTERPPHFDVQKYFPRPASNSLLEENSPDYDGNRIDFSVEKEMLKRQKNNKSGTGASDNHHLNPESGLIHKNSESSMLGKCSNIRLIQYLF